MVGSSVRVRVLSEWGGSAPCGAVMDLPDAMAAERVLTGYAERVDPVEPVIETAAPAPVEQAVKPKSKRR